jgi:hypothetical protein
MIHALNPSDQVAYTNLTMDMLERIDASPDFLRQMCFSDKATFHVSGIVNRYNCSIWGRGSPKVNVWSGLMHDKLIGQFFFSEKTVTRRLYLDMLELYALLPLQFQTILQQDGAPLHFCHHVRNHLDREMAERWIGRSGPFTWPPR